MYKYMVSITIGTLILYILGSWLPWKMLAIIFEIVPVLFIPITLMPSESPIYLLLNDKKEETAEAFQWLQGPNYDIKEEMNSAIKYIEELKQERSHWKH